MGSRRCPDGPPTPTSCVLTLSREHAEVLLGALQEAREALEGQVMRREIERLKQSAMRVSVASVWLGHWVAEDTESLRVLNALAVRLQHSLTQPAPHTLLEAAPRRPQRPPLLPAPSGTKGPE
jgi:hypothetical protein